MEDTATAPVPIQMPVQQNSTRQLRDKSNLKKPARYEDNSVEVKVPNTFNEAIYGPHTSDWIKVIELELQAHKITHTWDIVEMPETET